MIGLGCMRLSTAPDRDEERAVAVMRAALDAGATLLDTADAYCHDERDVGHNERLVAKALDGWRGDRSRIIVATKGGLRRPNGSWVSDGRAKHLAEACDASRRALGVERIDLYQLHAVDPRTPLETSVRALARLQDEGKIRDIGLCNVTVGQIRAARAVVEIASVQVSLSVLDDESLRNGVAEYCAEHGLRLIAYRPLGGDRVKQLARDAVLAAIARAHGRTAEEVSLAWLMTFGAAIVPIPGATRVETASSLGSALALKLEDGEREALDTRFSGRLLRVPRAHRRPQDDAGGEVVIVMGMPGAGKSVLARQIEKEHGFERLNRDERGGSLSDLLPRLDELLLAAGSRRVVLDNTYPTRASRNEVIETAWLRGVPVRCIWVKTDIADAQINAIRRMLAAQGTLPAPNDIRRLGRTDTRYLLPDAQFRYERALEAPALDEGFTAVDTHDFRREPEVGAARAVILDFDDLVGAAKPVLHPAEVVVERSRLERLARMHGDGWLLFVHAWRPQIERAQTEVADVEACATALRAQIGVDADVAFCPHEAGPPNCWCRKPIPGTVLEFAFRRDVALTRSIVAGTSAADRTMATRLGARFEPSASFFA